MFIENEMEHTQQRGQHILRCAATFTEENDEDSRISDPILQSSGVSVGSGRSAEGATQKYQLA